MKMNENHPKLKLKRKKFFAEPELPSTKKQQSFKAASVSPVPQREGPETPPPAAAASACSGADSLWALTVQWVLEDLQDPSGLVPELPPHSAAKPPPCSTAVDWDLSQEVPPFPEYSLSVQNCPDPLMDCSDSEHIQDTPKRPASPPASALPPHSSHTHPPTRSPEAVPPQLEATAEGCVHHGAVSSHSDQRSGEGSGGTGGTGGLLPSCPMCLMVFPLGFTQLDRDSHLAQCLSDMNIDMTW